MSKQLEESQKDVVIAVANKIGNEKRPSEYIDYIYAKYGIEVSNSVVCKALGAWTSRLTVDNKKMMTKAKELLSVCKFDTQLANYAVTTAMKQ